MSLRQGGWNLKPKKMKGKILNVQSQGSKGKWYCFEITVEKEDGSSQVYNKFSQTDNSFVTVGDVGTYDEQWKDGADVPNMKNFKKEGSQGVSAATHQPPPQQLDRDSYWNEKLKLDISIQPMIHRQSSLERAQEFCESQKQSYTPFDVVWLAGYYTKFVETGEVKNIDPFKHKPECEDKEPEKF